VVLADLLVVGSAGATESGCVVGTDHGSTN